MGTAIRLFPLTSRERTTKNIFNFEYLFSIMLKIHFFPANTTSFAWNEKFELILFLANFRIFLLIGLRYNFCYSSRLLYRLKDVLILNKMKNLQGIWANSFPRMKEIWELKSVKNCPALTANFFCYLNKKESAEDFHWRFDALGQPTMCLKKRKSIST